MKGRAVGWSLFLVLLTLIPAPRDSRPSPGASAKTHSVAAVNTLVFGYRAEYFVELRGSTVSGSFQVNPASGRAWTASGNLAIRDGRIHFALHPDITFVCYRDMHSWIRRAVAFHRGADGREQFLHNYEPAVRDAHEVQQAVDISSYPLGTEADLVTACRQGKQKLDLGTFHAWGRCTDGSGAVVELPAGSFRMEAALACTTEPVPGPTSATIDYQLSSDSPEGAVLRLTAVRLRDNAVYSGTCTRGTCFLPVTGESGDRVRLSVTIEYGGHTYLPGNPPPTGRLQAPRIRSINGRPLSDEGWQEIEVRNRLPHSVIVDFGKVSPTLKPEKPIRPAR